MRTFIYCNLILGFFAVSFIGCGGTGSETSAESGTGFESGSGHLTPVLPTDDADFGMNPTDIKDPKGVHLILEDSQCPDKTLSLCDPECDHRPLFKPPFAGEDALPDPDPEILSEVLAQCSFFRCADPDRNVVQFLPKVQTQIGQLSCFTEPQPFFVVPGPEHQQFRTRCEFLLLPETEEQQNACLIGF